MPRTASSASCARTADRRFSRTRERRPRAGTFRRSRGASRAAVFPCRGDGRGRSTDRERRRCGTPGGAPAAPCAGGRCEDPATLAMAAGPPARPRLHAHVVRPSARPPVRPSARRPARPLVRSSVRPFARPSACRPALHRSRRSSPASSTRSCWSPCTTPPIGCATPTAASGTSSCAASSRRWPSPTCCATGTAAASAC